MSEASADPVVADGVLRILHVHDGASHPSHVELAWRLGYTFTVEAEAPGPTRRLRALRHVWTLVRNDAWDVLLSESPCTESRLLPLLDYRRRRCILLDGNGDARRVLEDSSRIRRLLHRAARRRWQGVIVVGDENLAAARALYGTHRVVGWSPTLRWGDPFDQVVASQQGPVVAVVTANNEHRLWYKGLDRLAEISRLLRQAGCPPIDVFGDQAPEFRQRFAEDLSFHGFRDVRSVLGGASVLVCPSRRDPFNVAVLEAMLAGVVPVVGGAGAAGVVRHVEPRLIVGATDDAVAAVEWVRSLPAAEYSALSQRLRAEALSYLRWASSEDAIRPVRNLLAPAPD